jgi:hypothetical protein
MPTLITDALLATICSASYATPPTWQIRDVRATRTDIDNVTVVALPGTRPSVLADWIRDADAVPLWHPLLGVCHRGFLSGALAIFPLIFADLADRHVIITRHSLGGAEGVPLAGLFAAAGWPPLACVTFGAPRMGLAMLRAALAGVRVRQYRDGDDPVPELIPPYEHVAQLIQFGADALDPVADHSIQLYAARLAGIAPRISLPN